MGVFAYSREPGTKAASLSPKVAPSIAAERRDELLSIQSKISLNFNKTLVGRKIDVIIDFVEKNKAFARTCMDAPEIDNGVVVSNIPKNLTPGRVVRVVVKKASAYDLKGDFVR